MEKQKFLAYRYSNFNHLVVQLVANPSTNFISSGSFFLQTKLNTSCKMSSQLTKTVMLDPLEFMFSSSGKNKFYSCTCQCKSYMLSNPTRGSSDPHNFACQAICTYNTLYWKGLKHVWNRAKPQILESKGYSFASGEGALADSCELGNDPLGSIKTAIIKQYAMKTLCPFLEIINYDARDTPSIGISSIQNFVKIDPLIHCL
jgi:hypothetical protein